jgi:hypothetical protein
MFASRDTVPKGSVRAVLMEEGVSVLEAATLSGCHVPAAVGLPLPSHYAGVEFRN